jgi:hypothetical protein
MTDSMVLSPAEYKEITERMDKAALDALKFDPFSLKDKTVELTIFGGNIDSYGTKRVLPILANDYVFRVKIKQVMREVDGMFITYHFLTDLTQEDMDLIFVNEKLTYDQIKLDLTLHFEEDDILNPISRIDCTLDLLASEKIMGLIPNRFNIYLEADIST